VIDLDEPATKSTMDGDSWCTPPEVADPLHDFFGGAVGCDPCSNENSIIRARVAYHAGGLHMPWCAARDLKNPKNLTGYENYPYSKPEPWTAKMLVELKARHLREHVRLGPVATSTRWWRLQCGVEEGVWIPPNPRILFTGRLKFMGDVDLGARFDTALVYYGPRTKAFDKAFKHLTKWATWGRS
jgi:hypothetical protein